MPLINNEVVEESDEENIENNEEVKTQKQVEHHKIITDCGQEVIIKKSRSTKKQNITKPIVLYMEDLVPAIPQQQVVVKQKKGKGRPKKKEPPVVQYVNKDNEIQSEDDGEVEQVIINKPKKEKLSKKDLKMMELQAKIVELEAVSGKKIRGTKKGNVDKRNVKPPTEKQLAQRKKFVEDNKLRRDKKKKEKEEQDKLKTKDNVKDVVNELAELKKQNAEQREKIIKEMEEKNLLEEKKKEENKPMNPYANII